MISHILHQHLEFQLLVVGLCVVLVVLLFYIFVGWYEGRRTRTEKYTDELVRRLRTRKK